MEDRGLSLAEIREVPRESLVLLAGPPGAGKSDLCDQVVLNSIAMDKPVIFVTTEQRPGQVVTRLRNRGLGESAPEVMSFVDAYSDTVGVESPEQADTIRANCLDLNSISITTTRLQERMGRTGILLAFDSLTSPYLLSGAEVTRFMRLFLSKFAAEGNSVLALMDEGCGKSEDLVAMMSIADGVIKMSTEAEKQFLNVVKHPELRPTTIELPVEPETVPFKATWSFEPSVMTDFQQAYSAGDEAALRSDTGDFVNVFWPNLAHWSCMSWDPNRFPTMIYDLNKEESSMVRETLPYWPWRLRLLAKLVVRMDFNKASTMKRLTSMWPVAKVERIGVLEYLEDVSKSGEHYCFRVYENSDCWGLENVGAPVASYLPPCLAGICRGWEVLKGLERDWNAVETKCIGLGDPYCEFKLVPGEIEELGDSLQKDGSVIQRIHERLMEQLMGFMLHGEPLAERPTLGSNIHLHTVMHLMGFPHIAGERYRMAQRMGGAKAGKEIGKRLMDAGLGEDEAVERVIHFLNYCKVGKVAMDETIRIRENCESLRTKMFTAMEEPSCYFTSGFLNGLFSAVKNQHVREIRCITSGDRYCEWEII
jgi:predicted hydrocarbon binding protein/KaiC/GvpD/RAD55 family RecA-like ATPase